MTPLALLELYNAEVPYGHPQIESFSPQRLQLAAKALRVCPARLYWLRVFDEIHHSQLLRGLCNGEGHAGFVANINWLLSNGKDHVENYVKVYEGQYRDENRRHLPRYGAPVPPSLAPAEEAPLVAQEVTYGAH